MKKFSVATLLLVSLVLTSAFIEVAHAISSPSSSPVQPPTGESCVSKCAYRCSRNPRNLCKTLCMGCCDKCKCVPNGPFASKDQCPCYRDMKSKKGQSKCP